MRMSKIVQVAIVLTLGVALTWSSLNLGCNPDLMQSLGGELAVPTAPGQNPYILVRLVNNVTAPSTDPFGGDTTPAGYGFFFDWRYAGGNNPLPIGPTRSYGIVSNSIVNGSDVGVVVPCNVTVLTLGNVDDLTEEGVYFWYNFGGQSIVRQPLAVFGKLLQNGIDFQCGDVITFTTYNKPDNPRSYGTDYQVQSGQAVVGPFTGPDTFTMYDKEVKAWEAFWRVP